MDWIAAPTASARSVSPITRVGSVRPLGKCADNVLKPSTESAVTRNWSISDSPIGVPMTPAASTPRLRMDAVATRPAWPDTAATRCQAPVVVISSAPTRG